MIASLCQVDSVARPIVNLQFGDGSPKAPYQSKVASLKAQEAYFNPFASSSVTQVTEPLDKLLRFP